MIQKQGIIRIALQITLSGFDIFGDINEVAFESISEPSVSSAVVVEKENSDRMALGSGAESKLT